MNKKVAGLLSLLSISISFVMAQNETNIYWGKDNPVEKRGAIYLLGKRGDALLGYKQYGKNISIVKYSFRDLQVNGEFQILGKGSDEKGSIISKDYTFDQIIMLQNKNYVCVTQFDKKSKQNTLYMEEIDNSGHLKGGLKKIVSMTGDSKSNSGHFDLVVSKDSSKFVIVNIPPYEKYSGEKFGFQVYDEKLNLIDNAEVSLPKNYKYFVVEGDDITLSNDGIVYMLARITQQKSDNTKGEAGYYFELLAINPHGSGEVTTYELKLPEKAITDISYKLEEGKYIVCSGFYGNVKSSSLSTGQIDGVFYFRINKENKQIESTGVKVLDRDFVADITTERNANKGKGISNNFKLLSLEKRPDGGAILASEYRDFFVTVSRTSDGHGGFTTTYTNHYIRNNIIVVSINPDGSIKWYANIPKKQTTTDDNGAYSSFAMATKGDKIYIIYNDNPANIDPTKPRDDHNIRRMTNPAKSTAVLVELSASGQVTKSPLFNNKDNKVALQPTNSIKINDSERIIPAFNGGSACCFITFKAPKYKLARFDFN